MQGLAFLVTFGAIAKSDWPRAALEREGGKREAPFGRPFAALRANGGVGRNPPNSTTLTLTLSRAAGEGTSLRIIPPWITKPPSTVSTPP